MSFYLGDDGTLDTVIVCSECNRELRYNFVNDGDSDEGEESYDEFVSWAKADAADSHDCNDEN
jgi:hypothetical protein